jgi:uncharacterized metal-binding protein
VFCRVGLSDKGYEKCSIRFAFPLAEKLYRNPEEHIRTAALIKSKGYIRWTRVEETMEFAKAIVSSRIGAIFCNDMKIVADVCISVLRIMSSPICI